MTRSGISVELSTNQPLNVFKEYLVIKQLLTVMLNEREKEVWKNVPKFS